VSLAEPLKVRDITKGPPLTYFVLRNVFKFMHTIMRKCQAFRLIGTPESPEEMQGILPVDGFLPYNTGFLSGDYKGATNNIRSEVSNFAADEFATVVGLNDDERTLLKRALTGHLIGLGLSKMSAEQKSEFLQMFEEATGQKAVWPEGEDDAFVQQWAGQLMGSIVSFPFLNVANAAATRWSMELSEGKRISLHKIRARFNGDDIGALGTAKGPLALLPIWEKVTALFGLESSIGKTYFDSRFLTLNSRMFVYHAPTLITDDDPAARPRVSSFEQVGFIHMGMMLGKKKSSSEGDGAFVLTELDTSWGNVGSRANEFINLCPERLKATAYEKFLSNQRSLLKATRLPWFMPKWLGGLGLPIVDPTSQKNSDLDLRIAGRIILNWGKERPRPLGADRAAWKTRKVVEQFMPPTTTSDVCTNAATALDGYRALKTVDTVLFNSDVKLEDVFDVSTPGMTAKEKRKMMEKAALGTLNHNAKLWKPTRGKPGPKLSEELIRTRRVWEQAVIIDVNPASYLQRKVTNVKQIRKHRSQKERHSAMKLKLVEPTTEEFYRIGLHSRTATADVGLESEDGFAPEIERLTYIPTPGPEPLSFRQVMEKHKLRNVR
jgi:hypothetical protein